MSETQCFPAVNITLGIYGSERTQFRKRTKTKKGEEVKITWSTCKGETEIIKFTYVLDEFIDGPPLPGRSASYPFSIQLPDWLPASMGFGVRSMTTKFGIQYLLRAQVTPADPKYWANE